MMTRKKFTTVLVCLSVLILVVVIAVRLLRSTVIIDLAGQNAPIETTVSIDGELIDPSGKGGTTYKSQLPAGDVEIAVKSPLHKDYTETIKLGIGNNVVVTPKLELKQATDVASQFYDTQYSTITNEKGFPGGWVVFNATPKDGDETVLVIARLDAKSSNWQVISEGNAYFLEDLVDAPEELINYVDTL